MRRNHEITLLLHVILATVAACGLSLSACSTAAIPENNAEDMDMDDSTPDPDDAGDLPADDDPDDGSDEGTADDPVLGLTPLQMEAVSKAVRMASVAATTALALHPLSNMAGLLDGTTELPQCPQVAVDLNGGEVLPTLTYEPGCSPDDFPAMPITGSVKARSFLAVDAFETTEMTLSMDQLPFNGTVSGGISAQPTLTTLALNVTLSSEDTIAQGSCTAALNATEGQVSLPTATFSISLTSDERVVAVYDSLAIDAGTLIPVAGTVTIEMALDASGHRAQLEVTFDVETPTSRNVQVQLDRGTPTVLGM